MIIEDVLFFLSKINDGFEGDATLEMPVIKDDEAHMDLRVNDDLYQVILTKDHFKNI